ncbi:WG repeat-containing protein [Anabaena cylindrica UHCC 0172]|uniref:WG repeat-containing protein n=1 Tax=Anabaena cylindrica TaxID=1165 RepID=UPI002B1F7149|nr:WG repeat-containing protein [Anabaena cylindrica]MEA5552931.1 WG repeat-containing protein [Anabaena cylindrica UHCC 0172]
MIGNILRQRYKIIKELELKKGGFGETYLAEDLDIPVSPKPVCVVKRLKPTEIDRDSIRLFEQEARILYELGQNHNQIPKLYAHFQEGEDFYIIQEFIEGKDLTNEISPGKKLSESDVIQLLRDILEILVYVHDNKVIHRDIKPDNIMRRKDGKLVLIDFGAIKQINTTIAMKSGSTTRTINIGTWGYKPLEQARGKPKFSSDIYALGMIAIQALVDLSPRLLAEDDDGEIIWIDQVEISEKLEQFISKMVRYDWKERHRNAKDALEELNKVFVNNQILSLISKLIPVKLNGKYGYVNGGQLAISCQFDEALGFSQGIASVKVGEKWGYINTCGQVVIPYYFDNALTFTEELASVRKGEKWGYINTSGQVVIDFQFDFSLGFSEGIAVVKKGEKWGYINTSGQVVVDFQFDTANSFSGGLAVVTKEKKRGYINTTGKVFIDCNFDYAWQFSEGLAVVKIENKFGYINSTGEVIIDCDFDFAKSFQKGIASVRKGDKWGYINSNGKFFISCECDSAGSFHEGLAAINKEDKWGYISSNFQIVIPYHFDNAKYFSEGLAAVSKGGKWGYVNTTGQIIIPCNFDDADNFQEELGKVTINGKDYLIDKTGNIVY